MCMLFIKPEGLTLPKPYFDSLKDHNGDGVSCYNLVSGELFQTLDYDEAHRFLVDNHNSELVVHFRYGTSGKTSIEQLHGWKILNDKYSFFHNGMLMTFKGDKEKGLSDTQQLVNMFNKFGEFNIDDIVAYLEAYETGSRFLIVNNDTKEVIIPKCAPWHKIINIEGVDVKFSNNYALDWHLLQDNGHLNIKMSFTDFGYDDEYNDAEQDMLNELTYIIQENSLKDLVDFVTVNPEIAAIYLKNQIMAF